MLGGSASAVAPPQPAVTFTTTTLAGSATEDDWQAQIDGRLVIWEHEPSGLDSEFAVHNLATGQTRAIGHADGHAQREPDVSGDLVVYVDDASGNPDIMIYSWRSGTSSIVSNAASTESGPRIDGTIVVWKNEATGYLWYVDYSMISHPPTRLDAAGTNAIEWDVDNGRIYWSNPTNRDFRIAMINPPVVAGQFISFGAQPEFVRWHGDRAVYGALGNVLQWNVRSRVASVLASGASGQTLFDRTFAWVSSGNVAYRRPGHLDSTITDPEGSNRLSLYGHRMVWDHNDGTDWDVVLATGGTKLSSRTYGDNRYATAVAVSQEYFDAGPLLTYTQLDNVVLCTGENFPDALAAAPLARALQAPLLLTKRDSLPPETVAEIARLAPQKIYIIGGTPAISAAVETQLQATCPTERIAGADRYETSAKVAAKLSSIVGPSVAVRAFFARGDLFPDALALGPVAAGAQGPILLVKPTSVPASVAGAVDTLNIAIGYVVGDTTAVSANAQATLDDLIAANAGLGPTIRLAGPNRYDTAIAVINAGLDHNWIDLDTLGVATGMNFPDALGGGSAMGYYGSPVILTGPTSVPGSVNTFLTAHEYDVGRVDVFGGPDVVSDAVKNAIVAKLK